MVIFKTLFLANALFRCQTSLQPRDRSQCCKQTAKTSIYQLAGQVFACQTKEALDSPLTCHCKLLLRPLLLRELLPQLAGRNDTLHSHPVRRR